MQEKFFFGFRNETKATSLDRRDTNNRARVSFALVVLFQLPSVHRETKICIQACGDAYARLCTSAQAYCCWGPHSWFQRIIIVESCGCAINNPGLLYQKKPETRFCIIPHLCFNQGKHHTHITRWVESQV
jgi:hypothetical protein